MLKKITLACALVLVACLVAGAACIPFAVRAVLQDGEQILGRFIRSTEVFSFSGKDVDTLELHFNSLPIYVEQSGDEAVYLRIEGLFAGSYAVNSQQKSEEGKRILSLALDDDALFFDTGVPYLLRSGMLESPAAWVIVRIPDWVALETSGSGWNIRCVDDVRFSNREYYDERLWTRDEGWEQEQLYEQRHQQYHNQLIAIKAAYASELQQALLMLETEEIDFEDYSERIEEAASSFQERTMQQLPFLEGEGYQTDMLQTLLKNYVELQKGAARQQGRLLEAEEYSDDYYRLIDRQHELQDAAEEAFHEFTDLYEGLLLNLLEQEGGEQGADPGSAAGPIASSSLAPEEIPLAAVPDTEAPASPEEIAASSSAPEETPASSSPAEEVLSAPSVYTAQ